MAITLHTEEALPEQIELEVGRFRDTFQLRVDLDVVTLKERTAKAGWPEPEPTKLYQHYIVGKDDKAALKAVVRRAATLFRVEPTFYKDATTEAGHIVVKFHVIRKLDKDNKNVKDETLTEDGKPTPKMAAAVAEAKATFEAAEAAEVEAAKADAKK